MEGTADVFCDFMVGLIVKVHNDQHNDPLKVFAEEKLSCIEAGIHSTGCPKV